MIRDIPLYQFYYDLINPTLIGIDKLKDKYCGEEEIEEKPDEKYLEDIISNEGRNLQNIKYRVAKGNGKFCKIMTILEAFPFGSNHFEIGLILRDSLLTSSMLCNSEAWYNNTKKEMELLETVDTSLFWRILNAPKYTAKEMLYFEF